MSRTLIAALAAVALASPALAQAPQGGDNGGGVVRTPRPVTGEQVYTQVCQACHMADAKGATGAGTIPSLAANPKLGISAYAVTIVAKGQGAMPGFYELLDANQIAGVLTYLRGNFGNSIAKPVTAEDVVRIAGTRPGPSAGH